MQLNRYSTCLASALVGGAVLSLSSSAQADVWVFEPSIGFDQRIDDNYTIDATDPDPVNASRVVGNLELSRESQAASYSGLARIDGLLTQSSEDSTELSSNKVFVLNTDINSARSAWGLGVNFKEDTPSRDIASDITDLGLVALDTGASVTQGQDVARQRLVVSPNWKYNLTRRATFETGLNYTKVKHDLPSPADIRAAYAEQINASPDDDLGVFEAPDELDDFTEIAFNLGFRYLLNPITSLSFFASYSDYTASTEPNAGVRFDFVDQIVDSRDSSIIRDPKRESLSNTTTLRVGLDRSLTPAVKVGVQVGVYTTNIDETDVLRDTDDTPDWSADRRESELANRLRTQEGWLANVTASKDAGLTQYRARFGVDVLPSAVGSQVESLEAIGEYARALGPLLDFNFKVRAYEPDALNAAGEDEFSRRFLSFEPKLIWRFKRAWTLAGSYRYRRQKSQGATQSGESNAILFSIKFTPPSAIRDAAGAR
jgi:hypothetical protein